MTKNRPIFWKHQTKGGIESFANKTIQNVRQFVAMFLNKIIKKGSLKVALRAQALHKLLIQCLKSQEQKYCIALWAKII